MMPTSVKNSFTAAAPPPVKSAAAAPENAGGESFQDELVRRRRTESADSAAAARKAEPKRAPKAKRPVRPTRGGPKPQAQEPEELAAPAGEVEANAPASDPNAAEATDVQEGGESVPDAKPSSETEGPSVQGVDPAVASAGVAPMAGATAAAAPAGGSAVADGGGELSQEMSEEPAGAVARSTRASVYHGPGAIEADGTGEHAGDEAPAMAAGNAETPALFADDSSGLREDATPDGQRDHAPRPGAVPVDADLANAGEVSTEFDVQVTAPNGPARATTDGSDLTAAATVGLADAKPEARPATPAASPALPALPPEVRFASANHENIVTSMRAELMPNGGSMRIRLDPPQLGALQVTVQIRDGLVAASFETTSDEATRLLGHSLNQLKTVLEAQGVAVDKLQVQQAPRETQTSGRHDDGRREQGSPSQEQEQNARQEQQRREMLQRMWRRLAGGQDPLDLTA